MAALQHCVVVVRRVVLNLPHSPCTRVFAVRRAVNALVPVAMNGRLVGQSRRAMSTWALLALCCAGRSRCHASADLACLCAGWARALRRSLPTHVCTCMYAHTCVCMYVLWCVSFLLCDRMSRLDEFNSKGLIGSLWRGVFCPLFFWLFVPSFVVVPLEEGRGVAQAGKYTSINHTNIRHAETILR